MTREQGFSLIELIIAVAIAALLLGVGLPDLQRIFSKHNADAEARQILRHLQKTRELAIFSGHEMIFCGIDAEKKCVRDNIGRFVIFFDGNNNRQVDDDETVESELQLDFAGDARLRASGMRFIRYFNDGSANPYGSIFLCPRQVEPTLIRRVITNMPGRPYLARAGADGIVAAGPVNCES
jgi:prepilin-type N-terminal cleavage/methylation domain